VSTSNPQSLVPRVDSDYVSRLEVGVQYTEFSITQQGDLQIALTANGKKKLKNLLMEHADWSDDEIFIELIDEHLITGWTIIPPEQIRALRDLLILSNTAQYDEEGNISHVDSAYWHPNDQLGIVSTVLLQRGNVIFEKGR
jgi:hypothetical protein